MFVVLLKRQMIDTSRTDRGGGFGAQNDPVGVALENLAIMHRLVIESGQVDLRGHPVLDRGGPLIECGGGGTSWVLAVTDGSEVLGNRGSVRLTLLGDLVADAPHDDAGVIAVAMEHVAQVSIAPLVEVFGVAVLHFGNAPH